MLLVCLRTGSPVIGWKDKRLNLGVDVTGSVYGALFPPPEQVKLEILMLTTNLAFDGTINPRLAAKSVHSTARGPYITFSEQPNSFCNINFINID